MNSPSLSPKDFKVEKPTKKRRQMLIKRFFKKTMKKIGFEASKPTCRNEIRGNLQREKKR